MNGKDGNELCCRKLPGQRISAAKMPEVKESPDNVVPDSRQGVTVGYLVGKPKPLHRGRQPHRNSKGTAFQLFLYIREFSCVMNTRHGAGGGTRTHTPSLATDFESASSTNSNTPASVFSTSRSRCPVREIGGTSWRDIKNRIYIELSKNLDKSRFSSTAA